MESDGRIRSKDIGTGEVNSRIVSDLRSENYDGSHTDPENDPGLNGWQLLKSGIFIASQAIIRGTIEAAEIISAVIRGGEVNITSGGKLTVGGDPTAGVAPLVTLDESGLVVGDAPVIIDETGLTVGNAPVVIDEVGLDIGNGLVKVDGDGLDIGNGLTVIDSSGVQVGTDVVMDATGLQVDGGPIRSLDVETDANTTSGNTLTTTATQKAAVTFTKPSWAQSAIVLATARLQGTDSGFGPLGYVSQVRIDDAAEGGSLASQHDTNGLTVSVPHVRYSVITPGSTVEVSCYGSRNGGSGNPTGVWATIHATIIWLR